MTQMVNVTQLILAQGSKLMPHNITGDSRNADVAYLCPIADEVDSDCIHSPQLLLDRCHAARLDAAAG